MSKKGIVADNFEGEYGIVGCPLFNGQVKAEGEYDRDYLPNFWF